MSYLASEEEDTLPVPGDASGATVTFRRDATLQDEFDLGVLALRLREETPDEQRAGQRYRVHRTLLMLKRWTLVDAGGEPLPLTEQTLQTGLRRRVAAWLDQEALRRFDGRTGDDEGPFVTPSARPSTGTT